jgi:hypothetical protein
MNHVIYTIEGTRNLDDNVCFLTTNTYPSFQEDLLSFKNKLIDLVNSSEPKTFYKFGDGDYFFLNRSAVGSATPGRRALSKQYSEIKHQEFVDGVYKNDYITCELYPQNRNYFRSLYPKKSINFPSEFSYGLVSNKWLMHQFSGKIGLIGADRKIELIQKLMQHKEYQDYLGLERFTDYLNIPQKFACDDIDATEKQIAEQLKNSTASIFLVGIGHVKSALLHRLKKYRNAVFLDVGSSSDALAGIIDHGRPYFGDWTNYRVRDFDYKSLDILQYDIWGTPHIILENKNEN